MEKTLKGIVQYARKNYFSYWAILGIDTALSVLCSLLAYAVIHYMAYVPMSDWILCKFICVSLVSSVAGALLFHTYRNTIRFSQARELWRIMCAVLFKIACLSVIAYWVIYETELPDNYRISYLLFDGLLTLVTLTVFRVSLIIIYDFLLDWVNKKNTRILIYGIDEKSVALKLRLRDSAHYKVVGFYIYGKNNRRRRLADLPIYYFETEEDFNYVIKKHGIHGILFARYEDTRLEENRLLEYCKSNAVKTFIAPTISEADSDGNFHQWIRPIKIEDLLRQGIWGLSGSNGSSLVISRFHSQISIPEPFLEKKAEFSITVMPSDNKAVYSILAVDEDYKIYRGSILSLYQPNGRKRKLHAFDTDAQKMVPVLVEENLVTEFDYRFFPRYGSVVPTSAGNKYTGILGGCVPLVTGFGSGESFYGNLCGSAIHAKISGWKNQIPEYVQERNGWSLRFKDCSYLSLPLHIVPPYCGFELEIRFMPDSASEQKQTLISSGINGFNLTLENKKIYAEMFLGNRFYEQGGR